MIRLKSITQKWLIAIALGCLPFGNAKAQDDPVYFTHDFEDTSVYPSSKSSTEQKFNSPYGEWIYMQCSASSNSTYLRTGMGSHDLRVPKNVGSYVILPVMDSGVKTLTFWEGRGNRQLTVYTSTDGGTTWTSDTVMTSTNATTYINTVKINKIKVNRIKIANTGGSDADVDNISVSILAAGTKATITTGEATNITQTSADVSGTLTDGGDKAMVEYGICWALTDTPKTSDNKATASKTAFTIHLDGLQAGQTIYYRAYAITGAGSAYGDVKSFQTLAATLPVLTTKEATVNSRSTDHQTMTGYAGGTITDMGGMEPSEAGVVYGTKANPTTADTKALASSISDDNDFTAKMKLLPNTKYYYRAFATNSAGTAYGDEKTLTTGDLVISTFADHIYYCSPTGNDATADGSETAPFYSLQNVIPLIQPGDTIYMMAGTYQYNARVNIDSCGTEEKPIALFAKGGRAILDFSSMPYHAHSDNPEQGIRLTGSYWHFFRIDITKASDNGLLIERNKPTGGTAADVVNATGQAHDNIIEQCNFYKNGDTGLQIKNLGAYNKIINCDSYLNCDEGQGDADGFAPKISVGDGNYFYGCRAYLNSDDGWDVFFKKDGGFGDNKTIILENCVSYKNGFLDENTIASNGNGNGFKMGSDQGAMNVFLNRCIAVCNKAKGFDQNHNAGDIIMNNCTGMTLKSICGDKAYSYRIYESIASGHQVALTNCIAINDNAATDKIDSKTKLPKVGEDGKYGLYGRFEVDSTLTGMTIKTCDFRHADPTQFVSVTNYIDLIGERDDTGNLKDITFAHLVGNSPLIDAGTKIEAATYRGLQVNGIAYSGTAPDLGAYEYQSAATGISNMTGSESNGQSLSINATQSGILLLTVKGADPAGQFTANVFSQTGAQLGAHSFHGCTTAITIPATASGVCLIKVTGEGYAQTAKVVVK